MSNPIRIATRKSPLAMWQAEYIKNSLLALYSDIDVEILGLTTKGDKLLDSPLAKIGGKGLFVKELENKILDKSADIAVHSMKDVPVFLPEGLEIAAITKRDDPRDAFVSNEFKSFLDLPKNSIVGTSSLRRQSQLLAQRPDLQIKSLRGNVNTRLLKLDKKEYDAIILAAVGLKRLKLENRITEYFDQNKFIPAIGQGIIGIECRKDDFELKKLLNSLHDKETAICLEAERAMNERLNGGCQVPIGGHAQLQDEMISIKGIVGSTQGEKIISADRFGSKDDATKLGCQLADELIKNGADVILESLYEKNK